MPLFTFAQTKTCTLHGVVTYYFNEYQGDKPDIGASVAVVDSANANNFSQALADTFYYANFYLGLRTEYKNMNQSEPHDIAKKMSEYGISKDADFDSIDHRNGRQTLDLSVNGHSRNTTVDASGNYSMSLPPGTYYILIQSNNRRGRNFTEVTGKLRTRKVRLTDSEEMNFSCKFDQY